MPSKLPSNPKDPLTEPVRAVFTRVRLPSGPLNGAYPNTSEGQDMHFYVYSKRLEDTIVIQFVFSSLFLLPE